MNLIEQRILNKFKKEPLREISTTEIVREVHPEEYSRILSAFENEFSDKKTANQAKRKKGQLHRKILYHLNKLVNESVLKISNVKGKGEKYFSLNIEQGEIVVEKKHKRIVLSKPTISTGLIEEYESAGIVHKFDPEGWISKINCILLESTNFTGINKFYELIYSCFSEINDALGLNNFEHLIQNSSLENLAEVSRKLDIDTKDYDRQVNIVIDVKNIADEEKIYDFVKMLLEIKPKNISLVFKTDSKELRTHDKLFRKIIAELSKEEMKLNILNRKIHNAPIIVGKAGPYTLLDEEWKNYEENTKGKTIGLVFANTTIAIDVNRFFREKTNNTEFRELIMRAAKTLFKVSTLQKKNAKEYFKRLNELNKPYTKRFFAFAKEYIRFWNYDLKEKTQEHMLELLESAKEEIKKFCSTQQTIYKACGLPSNFGLALSTVSKKYTSALSPRKYVKTTIHRFEDFHLPEITQFISSREALFKTFESCDRIRFFRRGNFTPENIVRELGFLMNTYELPLITYDFQERKGEIRLTDFIG